jgi:hypothetical protein
LSWLASFRWPVPPLNWHLSAVVQTFWGWIGIGILKPALVAYCDPFKWLFSDWCRIHGISLDASTRTTFGWRTENGALSTASRFQSRLSLKNFLNCRHVRQDAEHNYSGTGKKILLKKWYNQRGRGHLVTGQSCDPGAVSTGSLLLKNIQRIALHYADADVQVDV